MLFPTQTVIFYVFSTILIVSAMAVITVKNPVKSVLSLVVCFVASAVLWMLMQAEFLSLVLIFVYVGAVMTLFLFVVMMLNVTQTEWQPSLFRYYPLGFSILLILVGTAYYVFSARHWPPAYTMPTQYGHDYRNVKMIGTLLFQRYLFSFELAAILLLVGMISSIVLVFHGRKPDTKTQKIHEQLMANKKDRLTIL